MGFKFSSPQANNEEELLDWFLTRREFLQLAITSLTSRLFRCSTKGLIRSSPSSSENVSTDTPLFDTGLKQRESILVWSSCWKSLRSTGH